MGPNPGTRTPILLCVPTLLRVWVKKCEVRRRERELRVRGDSTSRKLLPGSACLKYIMQKSI